MMSGADRLMRQEHRLMSALGVPRFGEDILLLVELNCVARRTDVASRPE